MQRVSEFPESVRLTGDEVINPYIKIIFRFRDWVPLACRQCPPRRTGDTPVAPIN
jgi:hypothetical protein